MQTDRSREWFVPSWGPQRFRMLVGLLFLPYTGMVLSFVVIGAMLAPDIIFWDRVLAGVVIYFLGLGIAAHALDALGSKTVKPWGDCFTKGQLWAMALSALVLAYAIGVYYMIRYVPLLWAIAILEGFFVFAYNLELFGGRFHTDAWFALSWGALPALGGYILQTNRVSWAASIVAVGTGLLSYAEISASRPYKELRRGGGTPGPHAIQYERTLKGLSLGVIFIGAGLLLWRLV